MHARSVKTLCLNKTIMLQPGGVNGDSSMNAAPTHRHLVTPPAYDVNCTLPEEHLQVTDKDRHALLYIVVVLLFYSLGIIVAIIMYLKREKEEIVEEKAYEDYMNFRADPDKWARYFRVQKMIFHLNKVERERDRRVFYEASLRLQSVETDSDSDVFKTVVQPSTAGELRPTVSLGMIRDPETDNYSTCKQSRLSLPTVINGVATNIINDETNCSMSGREHTVLSVSDI